MTDAIINSIRTVVSFVAYFLIVFGLGYIFTPKVIDEINRTVNKVLLQTDDLTNTHRRMTGIIFVLVAFLLLVVINLRY